MSITSGLVYLLIWKRRERIKSTHSEWVNEAGVDNISEFQFKTLEGKTKTRAFLSSKSPGTRTGTVEMNLQIERESGSATAHGTVGHTGVVKVIQSADDERRAVQVSESCRMTCRWLGPRYTVKT